jgi:hypothetical protein
MSALHAAVISAFKSMGWQYRAVPNVEVVECWFEAHHTKVLLHAQTHAEANLISVVSNASISVPKTHLRSVAELLMRSNKELNLGNLEMDWDSGQVMFRASNIFPPHRHDEKIIASIVHAAVAEMDRLTPFLAEICRLGTGELLLLDIPSLMAREDLLPAIPEPT